MQTVCNAILQRLRGLKLDELLLREVRQTLQQFAGVRIPSVLAVEKLILRAEETEPLEKQMLELLQQARNMSTILFNVVNRFFQGNAIAASDVLTARMHELLRKCDALGIETDIIERGKRLHALTVVKTQRRLELAQYATSIDLDELEAQVSYFWH